MFSLTKQHYLQILFALSCLILLSALIVEYVLGYQPCNLCIIERIPYGLAIIILILNHLFKKDQLFYTILLILVFSFSIIISVYHFGIEQGFIEESTVCASQNIDLMTKEQILNSLKELNISCKNVAFRVFGLSLTTYNLFASVLMLIMSLKILSLNNNHDIKK
ncbi:disulfide bond formation protein B [Candidatus Pelagibacter sp.]|uniref:disulfide bond formation protein B n=1 Tax=Candidatus Pelagibacter sp. TaxID=2024849 RepID=UPI003F85382C